MTTGSQTFFYSVEPILIRFKEGKYVVSSPLVSVSISVSLEVLALLETTVEGVRLINDGSLDSIILNKLADTGFLVPEKAVMKFPEPWNVWGAEAWHFHNLTRDVPFARRGTPAVEEIINAVQSVPSLALTRDRYARQEALLLPRVVIDLPQSLRSSLNCRRTHRNFHDHSVNIDQLSTLLHYTFAPIRFADSTDFGVRELRAPVGAGAINETSAYVVVLNVSTIPNGLYFYDQIRHGLVPVSNEADREFLESITGYQKFFDNAAFGVFTIANAAVFSWKYRHARAYRHMMQNVGAIAQVFSMVADSLNLGAAITGAIQDSAAEGYLGVQPNSEFVTFALACGVPVLGEDGLPESFLAPISPFMT